MNGFAIWLGVRRQPGARAREDGFNGSRHSTPPHTDQDYCSRRKPLAQTITGLDVFFRTKLSRKN
jgi:hypothetical protein